MSDVRFSPHVELHALSDNALLARLRPLPRDSAEREAICEILVNRYTRLVQSCVRPYLRSPEPAEDLLQVGYLGLLKAINGFDPDCGDSLNAYAQPCISGEIKRRALRLRNGPDISLCCFARAARVSLRAHALTGWAARR